VLLTTEQREQFDRAGIVRIAGAIAPADVAAMCDCVWRNLEREYQIRRDDPATWQGRRVAGSRSLDDSATFEQVASPAVCGALDDLLGAGNWQRPARWASLLVSFPEAGGPWRLPHQSWHLDLPASCALSELFGVRMFTCLAKLEPGGGATVVVAGSHRVVQNLAARKGVKRMHSADARKLLIKGSPWMRDLCSLDPAIDRKRRFMDGAAKVDGVEVRVVEVTGDPGDVILMHPLAMHAASRNCAAVPRIVLNTTVYRSGVEPGSLYN
jgi:Phytanoyl-CoA dioxygenase (PhyH)